MTMTDPILMSRKETMAMLGGISYDTFRRLLAQGSFPEGIRIGGRMRWSKSVVIQHLNISANQAPANR